MPEGMAALLARFPEILGRAGRLPGDIAASFVEGGATDQMRKNAAVAEILGRPQGTIRDGQDIELPQPEAPGAALARVREDPRFVSGPFPSGTFRR